MRLKSFVLAVAGAALLAGCSHAETDKAFGQKVRAYLMAHPEVIEEAMAKLQANEQAKDAAAAKAAIGQNRQALERDPRDFVANPGGKITVTEFYDYRCPHCVNVAPQVLSFIQANPDVRFVFKEMPIFGEPSEAAAAAAIAVKQAGGDYLSAYHDLMTARPVDKAAIDRVLTAHKIDPAMLDQAVFKTAAAAQIADIHRLALALHVEGTPAFIIGDTLVPGEDMAAVQAAVAAQRKKG